MSPELVLIEMDEKRREEQYRRRMSYIENIGDYSISLTFWYFMAVIILATALFIV